MPLQIFCNDITKMNVDAIVNATNPSLTGSAKITAAENLPCKYVIHTANPKWFGRRQKAHDQLASCYRTSLKLAKEKDCESIAFPLISSGTYGCPKNLALRIATDTIREFLLEHDMTVYLVVSDKKTYRISQKRFDDIAEYINEHYSDAHTQNTSVRLYRKSALQRNKNACPPEGKNTRKTEKESGFPAAAHMSDIPISSPMPPSAVCSASLQDALACLDESFSEMLLRKIDESGMTDSQCYKKANIDRRLFSKIRGDKLYKPSKPTALAFAVALELPLGETKELLMKAGFALSHSNKFDIIVEYFIAHGNYNIFEINEALFAFDQSLLGA